MKIKIFALVLMSVLCSTVAFGQIEINEERERQVDLWEKELPQIRKFETLEKLSDEFIKKQLKERENRELFKNEFSFKFMYSTYNSGQWDTLSDGTIVWRLAIIIPNKNFYSYIQFDTFLINKGTSVYVRNYSTNKRSKEYTSKHVDMKFEKAARFKNPKAITSYYVETDCGVDTLVLEYYVPKHITPGILSLEYVRIGISASEKDMGLKSSTTDCHVNISCPEGVDWQLEKRAVVKRYGNC